MQAPPETSTGRVVKTDRQDRRLAVLGENGRSWAAGFSYSLSWDEALKNAFAAVIGTTPQFSFDLWTTQYVLPEPGTPSVLEVGFYFTPS
jgi:hypothetical protein